MRAIGAVLLAITILFVGVFAASYAAQSSYDAAVTNGTNMSADAYNATTNVTEGLIDGGGTLLVYGGIGAAIIATLGFLVYAGTRGR